MFNLMAALLASSALGAAQPVCNLEAADVRAAGGDACAAAWMDHRLGMNDLTAVGTHNSYKLPIPAAELQAMIAVQPGAAALDYSHRPLSAQLDAGALKGRWE